ncbi:MAG: DoxX family protein [Puia sp.]|nr:DoxX family protein [Puia sp.]
MKVTILLIWVLRLVAAVILLQTLFFKFSAAPESVALFTKLGMEPWGRIGTGALELIASILILFPRTTGWGAGLAAGLMAGALFFHLNGTLGLKWYGDYSLFTYAAIVFICSVILAWIFRFQVLSVFGVRPKAIKA